MYDWDEEHVKYLTGRVQNLIWNKPLSAECLQVANETLIMLKKHKK